MPRDKASGQSLGTGNASVARASDKASGQAMLKGDPPPPRAETHGRPTGQAMFQTDPRHKASGQAMLQGDPPPPRAETHGRPTDPRDRQCFKLSCHFDRGRG